MTQILFSGLGIIVEFSNLYGCEKGEYKYYSACNQRVFLWNRIYPDGTFPVVFQEQGGSIEDDVRRRWELVPQGAKNKFQVRLCGICSYGPCCVYWALRKHWTYSELVTTYDANNAALFEFIQDGGKGFVLYACNHHDSCRYELTWEYLQGNSKVKWLSFQHYRNEGVRWKVKIRRI